MRTCQACSPTRTMRTVPLDNLLEDRGHGGRQRSVESGLVLAAVPVTVGDGMALGGDGRASIGTLVLMRNLSILRKVCRLDLGVVL